MTMKKLPHETLIDQPLPPLDFPWELMREFMTLLITMHLITQNKAVGEQILGNTTDEKQLAILKNQIMSLTQQQLDLQTRLNQFNTRIENSLRSLEGKSARLILPH